MRFTATTGVTTALAVLLTVLLAGCVSTPPPSKPSPTSSERSSTPVSKLTQAQREAIVAQWEADAYVCDARRLTENALRAYEAGDYTEAHEWNTLARWLVFLSQPEQGIQQAWKRNMEKAGLMRASLLPKSEGRRGVSIALRLSPELRKGIALRQDCLDAYLTTVSRLDCPVEVLRILSDLHASHPEDFWAYFKLAIALAIVHDVPPVEEWPHLQGGPGFGGAFRATPVELFDYFIGIDAQGIPPRPLLELSAVELKHVVDTSVDTAQLVWARQASKGLAPGKLGLLYSKIRYRHDRLSRAQMRWNRGPYTLRAVAGEGGICIDQAWFAAEACKALGVPSVIFAGSGTDGRHAWFGWQSADGKWHLDEGRGKEQRFASGISLDAQTWGRMSQQSLSLFEFASGGSRPVQPHIEAAGCYLLIGQREKAKAAMARARRQDPGSPAVWDFSLTVSEQTGDGPELRERLLADAAAALSKYPDLEYAWTHRLAAQMRLHGRDQEADKVLRDFAARTTKRRLDLGLLGDAEAFGRSLPELAPEERQKAYRKLLERYAKKSPIGVYDAVVLPFCGFLEGLGLQEELVGALRQARELLKARKGSQLENDLKERLRQSGAQ